MHALVKWNARVRLVPFVHFQSSRYEHTRPRSPQTPKVGNHCLRAQGVSMLACFANQQTVVLNFFWGPLYCSLLPLNARAHPPGHLYI